MKKILILIPSVPKSKRDDNWQGFADEIRKNLNGQEFELELWAISELSFLANGNNSKIWKRETGEDIKGFDLVVIRDAGRYREFAQSIAWYAKLNNIALVDRFWQKSFSGSKLAYSFFRATTEIPSPTSLSATSGVKLLNTYAKLNKVFGSDFKVKSGLEFPVICKAVNARKGNSNFLVRSHAELKEVLSAEENKDLFFIIQPFIPNVGDWRVLVVGGKAELGIFRSGDKSKTHLNNSSKGAETELFNESSIPEEIKSLAVRTAVKEKLSVAGVDIVQNHKTGDLFVLEANTSPQIQSGAFVEEKVKAYADGISRIAEREAGRTKLKDTESEAAGKKYTVIGRREKISIEESESSMNAKIDSGAYYCSLHVHKMEEKVLDEKRVLEVEFDSGIVKEFETYRKILVSPSTGNKEWRFVVPLTISIAEKEIVEDISLTSRSGMRYRFLIGRRLMRKGRFLINPSKSYYFGKHSTAVVEADIKEDNV